MIRSYPFESPHRLLGLTEGMLPMHLPAVFFMALVVVVRHAKETDRGENITILSLT
jgi:hypothetical protein